MSEVESTEQETAGESLRQEVGAEDTEQVSGIDLKALQADMAEIKAALRAAQSQQTMKTIEEPKKPQISAEEVAAMSKDPARLQAWFEKQAIEAKAELQKEASKHRYDALAEQNYPALKSDDKFKTAVLQQMQEYVVNGEYSKDHPMLLFRAAQMVAGKFKGDVTSQSKTTQTTSGEPPMIRQQKQSGKFNEKDLAFAKVAGLPKEKTEKFKQFLTEQHGRDWSRPRRIGSND